MSVALQKARVKAERSDTDRSRKMRHDLQIVTRPGIKDAIIHTFYLRILVLGVVLILTEVLLKN